VIAALNELEVITLFVENLQEAKAFYTNVFGLQVLYEDHDSAVIQLKNAKIDLLVTSEAHRLIAPTLVAAAGTGKPRTVHHQRPRRRRGRRRTRAARSAREQRAHRSAVGPTHRRVR
jgi:catechol 2,3-dioxygenase-like lactoylglutathione lyase family enzyme